MKTKNNLTKNVTLKKFQNQWIAFDAKKDIIAANTSYLKLLKLIRKDGQKKIEVTFIHPSNLYLAPFYGSLQI